MAENTKVTRKGAESYRDELMKAKVEFAKKALKEVEHFLAMDNQIIAHFEEIIGTVKQDIKANPDKFYRGSKVQSKDSGDFNISGGDIFSDLTELIKDVIVKDKDLVIRIVEKIFDL